MLEVPHEGTDADPGRWAVLVDQLGMIGLNQQFLQLLSPNDEGMGDHGILLTVRSLNSASAAIPPGMPPSCACGGCGTSNRGCN